MISREPLYTTRGGIMRHMILAVSLVSGLVLMGASGAWAQCDNQPTVDLYHACMVGFRASPPEVQQAYRAQQAEREWQAQQNEANRQAQVEAARQQALGMALFGSGPALIQGMNQGMQQMQVKPMPPMQLSPPVQYRK